MIRADRNERIIEMKKWMFLSCVAAILIYIFVGSTEREIPLTANYSNTIEDGEYEVIQLNEEYLYSGDLVLVNQDHALENQGVADDIIVLTEVPSLIDGFQLGNNELTLSKEVLINFQKMVKSAQQDGINHFILSSGYRDNAKQAALFEEMGAQFALPAGYSEHNLGLSLDIGSSIGKMEDAPEGKWLKKHAWEYGFILRYPEEKTSITGIQYEPWHFRYVGLPHSLIIRDHDWVLEEYLQYIEANPSLNTTIDGENYQINYYPYKKGLQIKVPRYQSYSISGDNKQGIIVTSRLGGK